MHIDISTKAEKRFNLLKIKKYKLTRNTLEKSYLSFIRPILEYGDVIWQGNSDLFKLDNNPISVMNLVSSAPYMSNQFLYDKLGWQILNERRQQHTLIIMYKILNNHDPEYLKSLIPPLVCHTTNIICKTNVIYMHQHVE